MFALYVSFNQKQLEIKYKSEAVSVPTQEVMTCRRNKKKRKFCYNIEKLTIVYFCKEEGLSTPARSGNFLYKVQMA